MIPTAILLGLIGGAFPRYRWWAIPIVGVVWSIILQATAGPDMTFADIWVVGFIFGALNAAIGVAATWLLGRAAKALAGPPTGTLQS